MTTLDDRKLITDFSGLTSTAITAVVFLSIGFTLEEVLKRLRRYPAEDARRAAGDDTVPDRGLEGWAMGYLYRARTYVPTNPTPDYDRWPLMWAWRAAWIPEKFYAESCGPDAAVYVRFLRGAFYWTLFLTCTVFPILTSLNWLYSPADISRASIDRASLSSLAQSPSGSHLLFVHVICLWILSLAWILVLAWIGYGAIRIRRNVLRTLLAPSPPPHADVPPPPPTTEAASLGWRFRSVLMRNIPDAMRSESAIREYFEFHLRDKVPTGDDLDLAPKPFPLARVKSVERERKMERIVALGRRKAPRRMRSSSRIGEDDDDDRAPDEPLVVAVVLVRKQSELNELWIKYREVLHQLETAHVSLAQNAVAWARERVKAQAAAPSTTIARGVDVLQPPSPTDKGDLSDEKRLPPPPPTTAPLSTRIAIFLHLAPPLPPRNQDVEAAAHEDAEYLLDQLRPFLDSNAPPPTKDEHTLWHVLHELDPVFLDRFQPLHKLRHFRGQKVPAIDYFLTKLNLLSALIEDKRANPEAFEPASSAFITFSRASDARRARHELRTRPGTRLGQRVFECKVKWAPEVRDLDWNKICRVSLSGDLVRGGILQVGIWAATIFWVIPLSFLVGLLSLNSISKYIPALAVYLNAHTAVQSLFSNLLPTSIVALLGMLVPTLIGILTRNGQIFVTVSQLHSAVQARYWKWLMVNIVIVFCVGLTAFTAFLDAFKQPTSVLTVVAGAFPKGATFFVSWALLVVGVHHGIEQSLFGIPFINHATIRNLKSPRKREEEALPRSFSYFYWLPNHLLVIAVTCIFAILNPMILPFTLVYQAFSLSVFKSQFAHVYWRRWYEGQGRVVFRRLFRYSLDCFMVAQVVALALFEVLKYFKLGGAIIPLIPITAFVKLIGTRWFDQLMDEIDEVEAELMCGHRDVIDPSALSLSVPLAMNDDDLSGLTWHQRISSIGSFATRTLPALTFHPHDGLPNVPSPHDPSNAAGTRTPARQRALSRATRTPGSLEDQNPILANETASRESSADSTHETDQLRPHTQHDPPLPATPASAPAGDENPEHALLTPHAPIVRDDRPVSHLHYANPAAVEPLAHSLWLPRDPLLPLDLGDTVNYHGHALVSSEGGRGIIGSWDEHISDALAVETFQPHDGREASQDVEYGVTSTALTTPAGSKISPRRLDGTERIRVASDIADRVDARPSTGRRRGSSTSSSLVPPGMRRRGTNASSSSAGMGSFILSSSPSPSLPNARPQDSPSFHRHHLAPPTSAPGIPSAFTAEPESLPSAEANAAAFPFPPPPSTNSSRQPSREGTPVHITPLRVNTTRQTRSTSFTLNTPPGPRSSPRSPSMDRSPHRRATRAGRSASHAASMQLSIAEQHEGDEEEGSVSQQEALRGEVLEEERREHAKRVERERKERASEREDKKSGWLMKMMRRHDDVGET